MVYLQHLGRRLDTRVRPNQRGLSRLHQVLRSRRQRIPKLLGLFPRRVHQCFQEAVVQIRVSCFALVLDGHFERQDVCCDGYWVVYPSSSGGEDPDSQCQNRTRIHPTGLVR